ncbi:MAG: hypothetical protein O2975_08490 [Proteobacteria bacterium]|nr:hypothetical protein [Pseudomonadota bacterium]
MRTALGFLGRHARLALPIGVFAGILLPDLAALLRPLLTPAVIGTLTAALLRLDWARLAQHAARPAPAVLLSSWQLIVSPALAWVGALAFGLPPDLRLALILQAAAPPIGSAAVFALILGLDAPRVALGTVLTTLLLPLTLTALIALLPESGVRVDLGVFFVRVMLLVAAPFALAWGLRRALGLARLARNDEVLGGLNVVLLVVFAIGVMDGVTTRLLEDPGSIGALFALSCWAALVLHAAAWLAFRGAGAQAAWAMSLMSGNRNMGLMLAITAGTAGETFALYVGVAQIPMYFAPLLLMPFVRRGIGGRGA